MTRIILLIADTPLIEDTNYLRLGNELLKRGYRIDCCFMDSLAMHDSDVVADGFCLEKPLKVDDKFLKRSSVRLADADVIWVLTLGMRHSFLDKIQLLHCLSGDCKIINSLEALLHFKSKYFLARHADVFQYPKTFTSTNPQQLRDIITAQGGKWIAKPPAGSLGRDVFVLQAEDLNMPAILESMTGPDNDRYCMIQTYINQIGNGEKRVLIANGKPIGQYLRLANADHRTNVTAGSQTQLCELSQAEHAYCSKIGTFLAARGAMFVGLDLAYPWVVEFNVVNPGGIQTIVELGGEDLSSRIIDEIFTKNHIEA